MAPRKKGFLSHIEELCEKVHLYLHYLNKRTERNEKVMLSQGPPEPNLEEFSPIQLKMKNSEIEADLETFRKLKDTIVGRSVYSPLVLSDYLERTDRHRFKKFVQKLETEGLPYIIENDPRMLPCLPWVHIKQCISYGTSQ